MTKKTGSSGFMSDRSILVWFALVFATALSWWLGTHTFGLDKPHAIGVTVLAIGFVKARFVASEFMELRGAPWQLRWLMNVWLVATFVLLATLFVVGDR
jgi:hypothetical protein